MTSKIFADSERLAKNWREERLRAYGETGNTELLKIRLYNLRHFYATKLCHRTKDPFKVKADLGHRNLQNTLRYCHIAEFKDDEYTVRTAKTIQEATVLMLHGGEKQNE